MPALAELEERTEDVPAAVPVATDSDLPPAPSPSPLDLSLAS